MSKQLPFRAAAMLALTALVVLVGVLNFRDRARWSDPTDGIYWVVTARGLEAAEVEPGSPADLAGIRQGDILLSLNGMAVTTLEGYSDILYSLGIGAAASYRVADGTGSKEVGFRVGARPFLKSHDFLRLLLALAHLIIGLFVIARGSGKPRAYHFFLICLASFVVYLYSFTPAWSVRDMLVYGISITAFLVLPALFAHFCLRFPLDLAQGHSRAPLIYLPAIVLGIIHWLWFLGHLAPIGLARSAWSAEIIERIHLVYFLAGFLTGGVLLYTRRRLAKDFITRQQMKWVSYGTLAGIVPFGLIYGLPWLFGVRPNFAMLSSQLFLGLIPLSFAYAIIRYRLIDVENILRRGAAYFIASLLLLAFYVLFVLGVGKALEWVAPDVDFLVITLAALVIALLFAPLRNAIQLRLDRRFYKERFEDRAGLMEFARTLSTEISLERLSRKILERIRHTFGIKKAALFLSDPAMSGRYAVADALGLDALLRIAPTMCEAEMFDSPAEPEAASQADSRELHRAHQVLQQQGIVYLTDLVLRGRRIGVIGLGALPPGRHFSSEDLDLLQALSGYAAIALDNANLYCSIQTKALELERLRKYTENILESINIAVLALDLSGRVTSCNRAFEILYGLQREKARGAPIEDVLPADVIASIHNATGSIAWDRNPAANIYKLFLENCRGERLIINLGVVPLIGTAQQNSGCLIVMDDITAKVQLEEQLLQVEKLSSLGLLAAGLAHEVNTPITGISSYAQMLLKEMPDSDHRKPVLEKIEQQTFRAAEIVNGLLNFARINGTEYADLDINNLIRESLNLLDHQLRCSRIMVEPALDLSLPPVYGNAGKLQQVFVNLFLNARDAMPSGGQLKIQTHKNDSMVVVDISDTGVGITEESIKRIFDPFYTTKRSAKGTGLGLAITYGIIQEHGGRIFVDSVPDRGTHFQVKLPTREALRA